MKLYKPPEKKNWSGREGKRYHQAVHFLDLRKKCPRGSGIALIGYACDEGIVRNLGRKGASGGPEAFRKAFGNLPLPEGVSFFDAGDVTNGVEEAQSTLTEAVSTLVQQGYFPLIIGGGHDLAYGAYLGLKHAPAIVNFDAHFDLRFSQKSNSGTPFRQIAEHLEGLKLPFDYTCIGIQPLANTEDLFQTAKELHVNCIEASTLRSDPHAALERLKAFLKPANSLFLNLDLDVFAEAFAAGVSAPQALGLFPSEILPYLNWLIGSKKVIAIAIAELSPPWDPEGKTARLAAQMAASMIIELAK